MPSRHRRIGRNIVATVAVPSLAVSGSPILTRTLTPPPTPTTGGDSAAYGYRPTLPAGWTLHNGLSSISQSLYNGLSNVMFTNCTSSGGVFFDDRIAPATSNIIFVDCDFRTGLVGGYGANNISFYACRMGDRVDADASHFTASTFDGTPCSNWTIQGCTIRNVQQSAGSGVHTDGIQMGHVYNSIIRHCYFDDIAVETILMNNWNGHTESVTVDQCYIGTRTNPGGAAIHIAGGAVDCHVTNSYTVAGQTIASIQTGCIGCSISGTQDASLWPHSLRADGWLDY